MSSTSDSVVGDVKNINNDEDKDDNKVSGKTFLKFLSTAYHLNEAIEDPGNGNNVGDNVDWNNMTNIELFANLLGVQEKCVTEIISCENVTLQKSDTNRTSGSADSIPMPSASWISPPNSSTSCSSSSDLPSVTNATLNSAVNQTQVISTLGLASEGLSSVSYLKNDQSKVQSSEEFSLQMNQKNKPQLPQDRTGRKLVKSLSVFDPKKDDGSIKSCVLQTCDGEAEKMRLKLITRDDLNVENAIKNKLGQVLQEGVLDSVLPYLTAKYRQINSSAQQNLRKPNIVIDGKKSSDKTIRESRRKNYNEDSCKISKGDIEVEIHVCDEAKNLKKDFRCSQKLLVSKMGYFAEVTTGQKLEDMDISVHCDINIFEWLMRWVKQDQHLDANTCSDIAIPSAAASIPTLDVLNVVPILVSASFLQMDPLLETCLRYCKNNMNEILKSPANLFCLNDSILSRLANMFSNVDVEALKDKKDKIRSRLYCKLIVSLTQMDPDPSKGHFSSFANVFKCIHCKKLILPNISIATPCVESCLRMCPSGKIIFLHDKDPDWNITDYIENLKAELKCWRRVYWRMWATCHFLYCNGCQSYYSLYKYNKCFYHPEPPQFFSMEQQRSTTYPVGRYSCCGIKAYRYESVRQPKRGCRMKKHIPQLNDEGLSVDIIKLFDVHHALIFSNGGNTSPVHNANSKGKFTNNDPKGDGESNLICTHDGNTDWWEGIRFQFPPSQYHRGLLVQGLDMTREHGEGTVNGLLTRSDKLVQRSNNDVNTSDTSTYTTSTVSSWHDDSNDDISDPDEGDDVMYGDVTGFSNNDSHQQDDKYKSVAAAYNLHVNKNKKNRCGIPRTQWVAKFSTRYNQDNQRDYEERAFQSINSMLGHRITNTSSSLSSLIDNVCKISTVASTMSSAGSIPISSSSGGPRQSNVTSNNTTTFSSYCRTLGLLNNVRINHPRSLFWHSHTPLGGTYIKIESEWREAHNIPSNLQIYANNSSSNNSSSRMRSSRVKPRPR